jgi:hypothetical protein
MSASIFILALDELTSICRFTDIISTIMFATSSDRIYKQIAPYLKQNQVPRRADCAKVAKLGTVNLFIYAQKYLEWTYDSTRVVKKSIKSKHLNMVQHIFQNVPRRSLAMDELQLYQMAIACSIQSGNISILEWLITKYFRVGLVIFDCVYNAICKATQKGYLDILKIVNKRYDILDDIAIQINAVEYGHLHIIKWIYESSDINLCGKPLHGNHLRGNHLLVLSILNGHIELFDWLLTKFDFDLNKYFQSIFFEKFFRYGPRTMKSETVNKFIKGFEHLQTIYGDQIQDRLSPYFQAVLKNQII